MSAIRKTGKVMLSELHVLSLPKSAAAFMLLAALSLSPGLFGRNASTEAQAQQQQMQYFTSDGKVITGETVTAYKLLQESLPLLQSNRNEEAVAKLSEAARLAPNLAEVHNNLGLGLAKLGRTDEAQAELEQAVRLKPELAVALMSLGGIYQTQGKIQMAIDTYSEFARRFPNHPDVSKVKAIVAGMRKEIAEGTLAVESTAAPADNYLTELKGSLMTWPKERMPIKVYIAPGNNLNGFRPSFDQILRRSFDEWTAASAGLVSFQFVPSPKEANITCSWSDNPASFRNRAEAGETNLKADSKGLIEGTIVMSTVPLVQALPVTDNFLKQTCLHEIGHALGFGGHTNNPADIMFFTVRFADREPHLGQRDTRSVQMLYSRNANNMTSPNNMYSPNSMNSPNNPN
jgi:tetratricopeptide (TPR) repeat protein